MLVTLVDRQSIYALLTVTRLKYRLIDTRSSATSRVGVTGLTLPHGRHEIGQLQHRHKMGNEL